MSAEVRSDPERLQPFVLALKERLTPRAVVVFGSRGRGEPLPDSDYDIVVVADDFEGRRPYDRQVLLLDLWYASGPKGFAADAFGLTSAELLDMATLIVCDMLEDGRVIFDDGLWRQARARFDRLKADGYLVPVEGGWRVAEDIPRLSPGPRGPGPGKRCRNGSGPPQTG